MRHDKAVKGMFSPPPFVCPACRSSNPSCILGCKNWWNIHDKWAWSCLRVQLNHNNFASFPGVFIFSVPKGSQLMLDREAAQDCPGQGVLFGLRMLCSPSVLDFIYTLPVGYFTLWAASYTKCVYPRCFELDHLLHQSTNLLHLRLWQSHRFDLPQLGDQQSTETLEFELGYQQHYGTMNWHLGDIPTWKIIPNGFKSLDNLLALISLIHSLHPTWCKSTHFQWCLSHLQRIDLRASWKTIRQL